MPFLTINAQTIEARNRDIQKRWIEAGTTGRAIDNSYVSSRHGKLKRQWRIKTKPMLRANVDSLMAILLRRGDHWGWPAATADLDVGATDAPAHSTRGAVPTNWDSAVVPGWAADGGRVYSGAPGVPETPFDRSLGSLWADKGTDNILGASEADPTVAGDLTATASGSLATESRFRWRGTGCVKVTMPGTNDGVQTADAIGISTSTWTGSVHVRGNSGGETITVRLIGDSTGTVATTAFTLGSDPTVWHRLSVSGATGADTTLRIEVVSSVGAHTIYVDGFQLEDNDRVTAWKVPGAARNPCNVSYPSNIWQDIGKGSFTVNCWVRPDNPDAVFRYIVDASDNSTSANRFLLSIDSSDRFDARVRYGNFEYLGLILAGGITGLQWFMATVVYDVTAPSLTLYKDGAFASTDTTPTGLPPDFTNNSVFAIGRQSLTAPTKVGPGLIADLSIFPYPASAATISDWYNSGSPAAGANTSPLVITGDILDEGESEAFAYCEMQPIAYTPRAIDGAWRNNAQVVDMILQEA